MINISDKMFEKISNLLFIKDRIKVFDYNGFEQSNIPIINIHPKDFGPDSKNYQHYSSQYVGNYNIKLTKSEESENILINTNPNLIKYITDPYISSKILAVSKDISLLRDVNFQDDILRIFILENGNNIAFINNPSYFIQKIAIQQNPEAIEYINNPSEELQYLALSKEERLISFINNPTEYIQLFMIGLNPDYAFSLKSMTKRVQKKIVQQIGYRILSNISNPCLEIQLIAFTKAPQDIKNKMIKNPEKFNVVKLIETNSYLKTINNIGILDE